MPVELRNVSFTYAPGTPYEAQAVDDLSLTVCDGEFVGVMGKTGCGKSTLIQLIAGLIRPSRGQILLDGEDINGRHFDRDRLRRNNAEHTAFFMDTHFYITAPYVLIWITCFLCA